MKHRYMRSTYQMQFGSDIHSEQAYGVTFSTLILEPWKPHTHFGAYGVLDIADGHMHGMRHVQFALWTSARDRPCGL